MRVACYICEEMTCYSCFSEKICKQCSLRIGYTPSPSDKSAVEQVRAAVGIKTGQQELA